MWNSLRGRVAHEPFVAVNHPLVAVAAGSGRELPGIRPGAGFRHGEGAEDPALQQRVEPALLLLLRAGQGDQFGVSGVGRLVSEDVGGHVGGSDDLVHERQLHLSEALAAQFGAEVGRPETGVLDLGPQRFDDPQELGMREIERLERCQFIADERPHPGELLLELLFGGKIPGHPSAPSGAVSRERRTSGRGASGTVAGWAGRRPEPGPPMPSWRWR